MPPVRLHPVAGRQRDGAVGIILACYEYRRD